MTLRDALVLGRVSNLPTVWTNTLVGLVLAGGVAGDIRILPLLLALSLFYLGGMYLNDAFDAALDAVERPERPIPSGRIGRGSVFALGFAMLGGGLALLLWLGLGIAGGTGYWPAAAGLALAAAILFYDWHHKNNPLSPLVMGLCRVLVYVTAGLSVAVPLPAALWLGAGALLCYLIGLTYIAKQENLTRVANLWPLGFLAAPVAYGAVLIAGQPWTALPWLALPWLALIAWMARALWFLRRRGPGDIPRAVTSLLAGICLLDAVLIAGAGAPGLAFLAVLAFPITVVFQRYVPAT
jgi:4-hydroxybenzoate polyprenyltransferase